MKRNSRIAMLVAAAAVTLAGAATAAGPDLSPRYVPLAVLVHVDEHGKVGTILPSDKLDPALRDKLRAQLARWIVKPAHDADGKPISSSMVVTLDIVMQPRSDGRYDATFKYLSSKRAPFFGQAHWVWIDHHRKLALAPNNPALSSLPGGQHIPQPGNSMRTQPPPTGKP
ncbi:MAG TPA: hypothetical protein VFG73_06995 [Rhodanobacteraceae bacterium]|nr:hypothetical protein [Rhodanobacteraceae bacterium]